MEFQEQQGNIMKRSRCVGKGGVIGKNELAQINQK